VIEVLRVGENRDALAGVDRFHTDSDGFSLK
jgi:hypothetical protein